LELSIPSNVISSHGVAAGEPEESDMGLGRGALLWLIGVPLPIIILLAVFWHH
jgi:hypothetical protein